MDIESRLVNSINDLKQDPDIRKAATSELVRIGEPAIKPLINASKQGNESMRKRAIRVMERIGWEPEVVGLELI